MTSRARIRRTLALTLVLLLAPAALARGDASYDRVASAYAASGGQLDPCTFTQEDLQSALDGIPRALADVVPDLRRAMEDGIRAHEAGDCEGVEPTASEGTATTPGAATPPVTTPTTPTPTPADGAGAPGATTPGAAVPGTTTPPPDAGAPATTPAPAAGTPTPSAGGTVTTPSVQQPGVARDRTPLVAGAIALGALLLAALLLWAIARWRGWDPPWVARMRHAWGEAGYRATSTWSEFTDWLRLGR
jgi:hypothetical protein